MSENVLLIPILAPLAAAVLCLLLPPRREAWSAWLTVLATGVALAAALAVFGQPLVYRSPWGGLGFEFVLCLNRFSSFILAAVAAFGLLVAVYSVAFMAGRSGQRLFFAGYLLTVGFAAGAVEADHLLVLLFFWEGLLLALFAMIVVGGRSSWRTAVKAFVISGVADLCLMVGVGLTGWLAGTMVMSEISLPASGPAAIAFVCLAIGALGKAGAMPFHSWIPDAADDAPLPFMALLPAAFEKLLGIYLLARICLDLFVLDPQSVLCTGLMVVGAVTILLAVLMALIQKDFKRLLSFHAISQVGYMVLGIGTGVPVGIAGGLFHMLNNALYKSCLFLAGGAVEKQVGTTDLRRLGGLARRMPVTFGCFTVSALAISGVPPFNGFFSKELVYDGALERGLVFYAAAVLGSFFTAASFLKLGHAAFVDPAAEDRSRVKEAPAVMLAPMVLLAALCVLFGLWNALPLQQLIAPALGEGRLEGHVLGGWPKSWGLVLVTLVVLAGAVLNHRWGTKRTGRGLGAVDHIHHAPVLHALYDRAEARQFDPYEIGVALVQGVARVGWRVDRAIDFLYERVAVETAAGLAARVRALHTGSHALYLMWSLAGLALILALFLGGL